MSQLTYFTAPGIPVLTKPRRDRAAVIISVVCTEYKTDWETLLQKCRKMAVHEPRMIAMYLMRRHTQLTLAEIGYRFDMDHTSVIHNCKACENRLATEPDFNKRLEKIKQKMFYTNGYN